MYFQQAKNTISTLLQHTKKPILILGKPGIGKSDMGKEISIDLKFESFIDIRGTTMRPPDLRGLMYAVTENGETSAKFAPMNLLPRNGRHLILFDELPTCSTEVQAALYQLLLDRQLGEYKLPPDTQILAAGNNQQDRAGATKLLSPLATRFITTINLEADLENWMPWANKNQIRPEIIAFLRLNPDAFNNFNPRSNENSYACPRSWANASDILNANITDAETLCGSIGEIAGNSFHGFLSIYESICKIPELIKNPNTYPVSTHPQDLYSVSTALGYASNSYPISKILTYIQRLPDEFKVLYQTDLEQRWPDLIETQEYCEFASRNAQPISI